MKRNLKLRERGEKEHGNKQKIQLHWEMESDKRHILIRKTRNMNFRRDNLTKQKGPILGKNLSRKDLFSPSTMSEIYISVPKTEEVCRRDPSTLHNPYGILATVIYLCPERAATVPRNPWI